MGKKIALFAFSVLCITFALIGCGGGGGGGTTGNPVGPIAATGPLADLSGTVKFSDQPLADAAVYLYKSEKALQAGVSGLYSMRGSVLAQTKLAEGSYSTKTDSSGRYSFTAIPVGEYTLIAVKDETHQFAQTGVMLGSVTEQDAQLTPTGKVSGRLLLTGGQPARGAIIHLEKTSYVAISDVNGDFTISHVPAGQDFTLGVVSTQGTLQNPVAINITPAEDRQLGNLTLTVPVQQVSTINGSVSAADSSVPTSALNGRIVLVTSADPTPLVALTDASGNFSLNVKAIGSYNVSVVGGEFAVSPTVQAVTVSTLGTTVTVPQSFVLSKPTVVLPPSTQFYTYSGTINKRSMAFNESDNAGVPLTLTSTDATANVFSAVTSPTGSFTFSIPAGTYNLAVGGGYAFESTFANPVIINAPTVLNTVIWVVPTQIFTASYLVEGSLTKVVKVNGESDDSNVMVTLTPTTGAAVTFAGATTPTGSFAIRVPAGTYNLAIAGDYKFETSFTNPITVNAATNVGNGIRLLPVNPVAVSYTVAGSINKVDFIDGETDNGGVIVTLTNIDASAELYSTVTTSGGAFSFKVDPGTYTLAINSGYKFATTFPNPVDASAGNVSISPVIDILPLAAKLFTFSGSVKKVLRKDGETNDGDVNITLRSDSATFMPQTTVSEANGSFTFKIPPGNYAVEAGSGYAFVTPTSGFPYSISNADLIVSPGLNIRPSGTLPAAFGGNLPLVSGTTPYRVRIEKTDNTYTDNETTTGGFYFDSLPPGEYRVVILPDGNGFYGEYGPFNLAEGQKQTGVAVGVTQVSPAITNFSATESILTISGSGFGYDVSSFSILIDGNRRARPVAGILDDAQDQAMIVSVTPGQHNIVAEKIWNRPTTNETFVLKSAPVSFNKLMGSPINLSAIDITDISASLSWTNAQFSQQAMISVFQGATNISNSPWFDGNTYKLTGLASNTTYTVHLYNRFGDIESTVVTANFTTKKAGFSNPGSMVLAGSSAIVASMANGLEIFGFELMNDRVYVGFRETAAGQNFAYVNSYDAAGNQLATFTINAFTTNPAICQLEKFDMCVGNNSVYVTYIQDITTIQQVQRLDENLSPVGGAVNLSALGINAVEKVKMEFHGTKLFFSVNDNGTTRNYYVYSVNSDLSGSAVQVYNTSNILIEQSPIGYWLMTAADESSDSLFIAVAQGAASSVDNITIIKKSLSSPAAAGQVLNTVMASSMVLEFGMSGSNLILNGGSSSPDFYKITSNLGYVATIDQATRELSSFGVDLKGRFWAFSNSDYKHLVNLSDSNILNELTIQGFPGSNGGYTRPREFAKLQTIGNPGKFGMLFIDQFSQLAVFGYDSSF